MIIPSPLGLRHTHLYAYTLDMKECLRVFFFFSSHVSIAIFYSAEQKKVIASNALVDLVAKRLSSVYSSFDYLPFFCIIRCLFIEVAFLVIVVVVVIVNAVVATVFYYILYIILLQSAVIGRCVCLCAWKCQMEKFPASKYTRWMLFL